MAYFLVLSQKDLEAGLYFGSTDEFAAADLMTSSFRGSGDQSGTWRLERWKQRWEE